jgi:sugar phosphate isomerase/epimerase
MKYGIRDGCLRLPWEQVFETAGQIGFDGVELDIGANFRETLWWTPEGRRQIQQWADRSGCRLASVCLGVFWKLSPADPDPAIRAQALEVTTLSLRFCGEMGVEGILAPVTPGPDTDPATGTERWIEFLRQCGQALEETGVRLALENVGRGYGDRASQLLRMIDEAGAPHLGIYYDPGNGLSLGQDPASEIREIGHDRMALMHAKDPGGTYLGEGKLDWLAVVAAIHEIDYNGWQTLETPATDDPPAAAAHNLRFLREQFEPSLM